MSQPFSRTFQVRRALLRHLAPRYQQASPAQKTLLLEGHGHLQLTEEERRQLLAMSVSTAERFLRTQRKPRLYGLSTTTHGPWCKAQIPVRTFSQWEQDRPGFVEMERARSLWGAPRGEVSLHPDPYGSRHRLDRMHPAAG